MRIKFQVIVFTAFPCERERKIYGAGKPVHTPISET